MPVKPPILDNRALQDIMEQLKKLAKIDVPEWMPLDGDAGTMLQRVFARLLEIALERLNKAPEKNLLAFLDTMVVSLLPPSPAKAPLTFTFLPGSPAILVPKGTQAGTQPGGQQPEVIFETEDDLTVIPAQLTSGFTMDPVWDRYTEQTSALSGQSGTGFTPFVGSKRTPHVLYLGDDDLLNFKKATIEISFLWQPAELPLEDLRTFFKELSWQYLQNGLLKKVVPYTGTTIAKETQEHTNRVKLANLTGLVIGDVIQIKQGEKVESNAIIDFKADNEVVLARILKHIYGEGAQVEIASPPVIRLPNVETISQSIMQGVSDNEKIQTGITGCWLQVILTAPLPDVPVLPELMLRDLRLNVSAADLLPALAFSNTAPLDVTKEFLPFGEVPKVGDAFYIACQEAFSKPDAKVTLKVDIKPAPPPKIIWEYWNWDSATWTALPTRNIVDGTASFTKSGTISLLVPASFQLTQAVASYRDIILRVRVVSGKYRCVPKITRFERMTTDTTLKYAANAEESSVLVEYTNFAMYGHVLKIGTGENSEYVVVTGVTGNRKFEIRPSLAVNHNQGQPVKLLASTPVARLSENVPYVPSPGMSPVLPVDFISGDLIQGDVLLIDDGEQSEFVTVNHVIEVNIPVYSLHIKYFGVLKYDHAKGVSLARVTPVKFIGMADGNPQYFTGSFYPFGKNPSTEDIFYFMESGSNLLGEAGLLGRSLSESARLANQTTVDRQLFGHIPDWLGWPILLAPEYRININVEFTPDYPELELQWEYLGTSGWQPINPLQDDTEKFRKDGTNSIELPKINDPLAITFISPTPAEVNGQKNYWVRARITHGNYGLPAEFIPVNPTDLTKGYALKPGTGNLNPPVITRISLSYKAERVPTVLTQNGFFYTDQTSANTSPAGFTPFISVKNLPDTYADAEPSLYLGFDADFPEQPVTLYAAVTPRSFAGSVVKETRAAPAPPTVLPPLRWEYFNGTAWKELVAIDGTNNLTESGTIEFLTPADIKPLAKFDLTERYWIRALSSGNAPLDAQHLSGVFLNTISAVQAVTVFSETIGSGSGLPNQTVSITRMPVLSGGQVMVREPEPPSDRERADIEAEEGASAIQERVNSVTGETEIWVRWHEVANFLQSDSHSRHYLFDYTTGLLTFGDGKRGMIPPRGADNIAATYRTGGGAGGNVPKGAIAQIKSPLPGVAAVTNPVSADGGADAETVPMVIERGPQTLKHRGRAVAGADFEWLARQAAGVRVARTKYLSNVNRDLQFEPGWVTLIIVPQGSEAKLSPGSELVREVEDYIEARTFIGLAQQAPARVNVIGPGYIQVAVGAKVVPQDIDGVEQVKRRASEALAVFFHPLKGGPKGTGWAFGRDVYASEVYQLLESVPGVSYVKTLELKPNIAQHRFTVQSAPTAAVNYPEDSTVLTIDRKKAALLVEPVPADTTVERVTVKGFKEGDRITRVLDLKVLKDLSKPADSDTITVDKFSDGVGFPQGSLVMTSDGTWRTNLKQGILLGKEYSQIVVEDSDFVEELKDQEYITIFYPFPMTVTSVQLESAIINNDSKRVQSLGIDRYEAEVTFPENSILATLDNHVRMPLAADIPEPDNQIVTAVKLLDFDKEELITITRRDFATPQLNVKIENVEPANDIVYLGDNFLVYSGKHSITMVAEKN